jgi:hypothetical protein
MDVRALTDAEASRWDALVAVSPQRSIFAERWWMAAVTGGEVRMLGCFAGDTLVAGLPIWPARVAGMRLLRQPPLTPCWGPLLAPIEGKPVTRLGTEMQILRAFADALAAWPDSALQFHPTLTNWLPFHWRGFAQTTRYTYRIPDTAAFLRNGSAAHESLRRQVRHARKAGLTLRDGVAPAVVEAAFRATMSRHGGAAMPCWPALAAAAAAQERLFTTAAVGDDGAVHSAFALVWDDRFAYDIFGGGDPRFRASYSSALAHWHLLEAAAERTPGFDFEGSMLEPVERFYRSFGGELTPYLHITRQSGVLNMLRKVRDRLHKPLGGRASSRAAGE